MKITYVKPKSSTTIGYPQDELRLFTLAFFAFSRWKQKEKQGRGAWFWVLLCYMAMFLFSVRTTTTWKKNVFYGEKGPSWATTLLGGVILCSASLNIKTCQTGSPGLISRVDSEAMEHQRMRKANPFLPWEALLPTWAPGQQLQPKLCTRQPTAHKESGASGCHPLTTHLWVKEWVLRT